MKKLLTILFIAVTMLGAPLLSTGQGLAFNPFPSNVCNNSNSTGDKSLVCSQPGKDPLSGRDQEGAIIKVTRLIAMLTGVAAVIVIIIGGFEYVLASGDSARITKAKDIILFAVVGLIVASLAGAIIQFVLVKL